MNFSRVIEETEKIEVLSRKLQVLENLLTDITICNSGQHHKGFTLSWINEAAGENMSFDFWVSDPSDDTAKALSELANTERSRLRLKRNFLNLRPVRYQTKLNTGRGENDEISAC